MIKKIARAFKELFLVIISGEFELDANHVDTFITNKNCGDNRLQRGGTTYTFWVNGKKTIATVCGDKIYYRKEE